MRRQPSGASASPVGWVTLTLYGPSGELAAALRILADALGHEQATRTVSYTAALEPHARGPAPGGMTAELQTGSSPSSPRLPSTWWRCCAATPPN